MIFRTVFLQEVRTLSSNRAWWSILALLFALTMLAAWNGGARVANTREEAARLNQDEATLQATMRAAASRYDARPVGDPPVVTRAGNVGLSLLGHYAALGFAPLAGLSVGQSDVQPSHYRVTAHPRYTFVNASEIHNPLTQVSGSFDVAFVWIFILPILIIATSFDLISREKESGTLALVAAQGVPVRTLMLAKAAARIAMILPLIAVLVLLAGAVVGASPAEPGVLLQLLMIFAVVAAYALFWFALALAVNALEWRSETNGVVLANIWLVLVVVLPSFVNVAASTIYPAPSRVELTTETREASEVANRDAASAREAYLFDHPELAGAGASLDDYYIEVLATEAVIENAIAPLLDRFDQQAASRDRIVSLLRYASPAIAAQDAFNALAGTDNQTYANFITQVAAFHEYWRTFFATRIVAGARLRAADFDAIPQFVYRPPSVARAVDASIGPFFYLVLATLAFVLWGGWRFSRYHVV